MTQADAKARIRVRIRGGGSHAETAKLLPLSVIFHRGAACVRKGPSTTSVENDHDGSVVTDPLYKGGAPRTQRPPSKKVI